MLLGLYFRACELRLILVTQRIEQVHFQLGINLVSLSNRLVFIAGLQLSLKSLSETLLETRLEGGLIRQAPRTRHRNHAPIVGCQSLETRESLGPLCKWIHALAKRDSCFISQAVTMHSPLC